MVLSSGVLVYRINDKLEVEVLLAHPGGPYYQGTDLDSWSIPKGKVDKDEDIEDAARREFKEETGFDAPKELTIFGYFRVTKEKMCSVFVGTGDYDLSLAKSNYFSMVWDGAEISVPEIDKWEWFDLETALKKITFGQKQIIVEAMSTLDWN